MPPELDLVEAEDQITHNIDLDDKLEPQVRTQGGDSMWVVCVGGQITRSIGLDDKLERLVICVLARPPRCRQHDG